MSRLALVFCFFGLVCAYAVPGYGDSTNGQDSGKSGFKINREKAEGTNDAEDVTSGDGHKGDHNGKTTGIGIGSGQNYQEVSTGNKDAGYGIIQLSGKGENGGDGKFSNKSAKSLESGDENNKSTRGIGNSGDDWSQSENKNKGDSSINKDDSTKQGGNMPGEIINTKQDNKQEEKQGSEKGQVHDGDKGDGGSGRQAGPTEEKCTNEDDKENDRNDGSQKESGSNEHNSSSKERSDYEGFSGNHGRNSNGQDATKVLYGR